MDSFSVIKYPLTTECAMKKIEDYNTLVFITDVRANKHQIKAAVKKVSTRFFLFVFFLVIIFLVIFYFFELSNKTATKLFNH